MGEPFGGPITLVVGRDALAEDATLGWGDMFGEQLRVAPIDFHAKPRRKHLAITSAIRSWLQEIEIS